MPNSTNIELTLHIHHPKSLFWTLGKTLSGFRGIHCFNMFQHVTKLRPNRGNAQHPSNKGNNSPQITNKKQICQRETPQNISKAYQLSDKTHPCIFFLCFLFEDWCPASALKRYASQFKKCCNGADLKGCRTSTTPSAAVSLDTSHHITSPWHDATSLRQDSRAFSKWLPDPAESAQLILRYTPHHSWIVVTTRGIAKICQYPAKSHQAKPISNLQKLSSLLEIWETAGESTRMSGPNVLPMIKRAMVRCSTNWCRTCHVSSLKLVTSCCHTKMATEITAVLQSCQPAMQEAEMGRHHEIQALEELSVLFEKHWGSQLCQFHQYPYVLRTV